MGFFKDLISQNGKAITIFIGATVTITSFAGGIKAVMDLFADKPITDSLILLGAAFVILIACILLTAFSKQEVGGVRDFKCKPRTRRNAVIASALLTLTAAGSLVLFLNRLHSTERYRFLFFSDDENSRRYQVSELIHESFDERISSEAADNLNYSYVVDMDILRARANIVEWGKDHNCRLVMWGRCTDISANSSMLINLHFTPIDAKRRPVTFKTKNVNVTVDPPTEGDMEARVESILDSSFYAGTRNGFRLVASAYAQHSGEQTDFKPFELLAAICVKHFSGTNDAEVNRLLEEAMELNTRLPFISPARLYLMKGNNALYGAQFDTAMKYYRLAYAADNNGTIIRNQQATVDKIEASYRKYKESKGEAIDTTFGEPTVVAPPVVDATDSIPPKESDKPVSPPPATNKPVVTKPVVPKPIIPIVKQETVAPSDVLLIEEIAGKFNAKYADLAYNGKLFNVEGVDIPVFGVYYIQIDEKYLFLRNERKEVVYTGTLENGSFVGYFKVPAGFAGKVGLGKQEKMVIPYDPNRRGLRGRIVFSNERLTPMEVVLFDIRDIAASPMPPDIKKKRLEGLFRETIIK